MPSDLLQEARCYMLECLRGKPNAFESKHPWRKDWEFAVLHCLRVEDYAQNILTRETLPLTEREVLLLRLAAILHDIARNEIRDQHAARGAQKAQPWLQAHAGPALTPGDIERVVEMIADHSNKEVHEPDFSKAVLKDADTLDEIGAMSIFMAANWLEKQSPFFFHDLRRRLSEVEIPYCDKKLAILNTAGAKEILREKKAFIENFIAQLGSELQADPSTEQLMLEAFRNTH